MSKKNLLIISLLHFFLFFQNGSGTELQAGKKRISLMEGEWLRLEIENEALIKKNKKLIHILERYSVQNRSSNLEDVREKNYKLKEVNKLNLIWASLLFQDIRNRNIEMATCMEKCKGDKITYQLWKALFQQHVGNLFKEAITRLQDGNDQLIKNNQYLKHMLCDLELLTPKIFLSFEKIQKSRKRDVAPPSS
ncbi:MAG: hypothetical protein LBI95_01795 [Holosporales bacterium]|jgi:hypothetical protein|nr:hypothetical protein [Holosporales bacterium]